jgi:CheY-like chemotaxis protein
VKPATTEALEGALDRIRTYAEPQTRKLLVIEDNQIERDSIVELLAHDDIMIEAVGTGADAIAALDAQRFDCIVVDLRLPDVSGRSPPGDCVRHRQSAPVGLPLPVALARRGCALGTPGR